MKPTAIGTLALTFALLLIAVAARADTKISALPAGATLVGTEAMPAVQSGATVRTNPASIVQLAFTSMDSTTITGKFSGTCNATSFLRGDGACTLASLTSNVSGTLPVANGGTGVVTLTGLALGNGTSAFSAYPGAACTNQFLRSLAATGAGTCATISLTADITGTLPVANGGSGAVTLTGPLKGNGTSALSAAAAADIYGLWSGTCNASSFLRGDGACAAGNAGTVTSVALTMPAIFSTTGSPLTTSGTIAVQAAGTSGGIPYFSGTTTLASSAALGANAIVLGAGAASAPVTDADFAWVPSTNVMTLGTVATPATITAPAASTSNGGSLSFIATAGSGSDKNGGNLTFTAGAKTGVGTDGAVIFNAPGQGGTTNILQLGNGDASFTGNVSSDITFAVNNLSAANASSTTVAIGNSADGFLMNIFPAATTPSPSTNGPTGAQVLFYNLTNIPFIIGAGTAPNAAFMVDQNSNVVTQFGSHATSATQGFLYVPKIAGLPTGVPASLTGVYANASPFAMDSTNFQLCSYIAAWHCAPMLDTAASTWTGVPTWSLAEPRLKLSESDQGADLKLWDFDLNAGVLTGRTRTDADGAGVNWVAVTRGATTAISDVSFGNATNNPTYTFLGTGTATFGGQLSATRVNATGASAPSVGIYRPGTNRLGFACAGVECGEFNATGQLIISLVGQGLSVKEGTNAKMGVATLVGGTVVVSTTAVTASSRILLTEQTLGTVAVPSAVGVSARTAGTSFTILASAPTDTSTVAWMLVEPSP